MDDSLGNLLLLVILGSTIFMTLAGFIVFFVVYYQKRMLQNKMEQQLLESEHQKKLLKTTMESQEVERKRIASELHDGVGAMLSAAKLNLNFLKSSVDNDTAVEAISEMKGMIDDTIETVRRISKDLLPASLEKFGLIEAVREFCEKVGTPATKVVFEQTPGEYDLAKSNELPIYRLIQEIVNNALKHANANKIYIHMNLEKGFILSVSDDGLGFDVEEVKNDINKGVGIYNIESRVNMLGGTMELTSQPDAGTSYTIKMDA